MLTIIFVKETIAKLLLRRRFFTFLPSFPETRLQLAENIVYKKLLIKRRKIKRGCRERAIWKHNTRLWVKIGFMKKKFFN